MCNAPSTPESSNPPEDLSPLAQIQSTYGLKTREAVEMFIQLDSEDQIKVAERMRTLLENKRIIKEEGNVIYLRVYPARN